MNPKTIINLATKAVKAVRSAIKEARQSRNAAKQASKQKEQPTGIAKQGEQNEKADMDRAQNQAKEMKDDLQKQGLGQKGQEVTGHDGSIPQGGSGNNNGNSGSYNPSRGRELGTESRAKGREL